MHETDRGARLGSVVDSFVCAPSLIYLVDARRERAATGERLKQTEGETSPSRQQDDST